MVSGAQDTSPQNVNCHAKNVCLCMLIIFKLKEIEIHPIHEFRSLPLPKIKYKGTFFVKRMLKRNFIKYLHQESNLAIVDNITVGEAIFFPSLSLP